MEQVQLQDSKPETGTTTIGDGNTITHCNLRNCAVTSSSVRHSDFSDCVLSHVRSAKRSTGTKTHFHQVSYASRSTFSNSVVRDRSAVHRSDVKTSTVKDASNLRRSTIIGSNVCHTSVSRTTLDDCDTEECFLERCTFKGMILKNGYWKRNKLIKKVGGKEPICIKKDGSGPVNYAAATCSTTVPMIPELSSKTEMPPSGHDLHHLDSDVTLESEESDVSQDLPPPYKV
ncbi:uncharacterized protein N7473_012699 [Penicillium subrubescens]|uniref:Uncharacterized protein n=1 Tax=Penicillium subrubescens TaxID=1316194 RepID=A0A1Q5U4G2_9EURO|nr:uncharacterized protein N7473_012699 [Penicillium subrubescens]KAJ5875352.1 hypothetical protein N7473_012699 [Penicillium subrubescens]OKP07357.1 hypothetical protein PENSUB_5946 [Penicillium subrubescens]